MDKIKKGLALILSIVSENNKLIHQLEKSVQNYGQLQELVEFKVKVAQFIQGEFQYFYDNDL